MQVIIPPDERERLVALGSTGIMREIADGKHCEPTAPYRDAIDALLASVKATEDSEALARAEAREADNSSIARKALLNSYAANIFAAIAIIIAVIAMFNQK